MESTVFNHKLYGKSALIPNYHFKVTTIDNLKYVSYINLSTDIIGDSGLWDSGIDELIKNKVISKELLIEFGYITI
jgi:hypothetical protein